jgi:SulP family sulfate permease
MSAPPHPASRSEPLAVAARAVGAGIVCGFLALIQSAGFGLLLLGGGDHAFAPVVVGMALFATAVATIAAVLTGSFPGTIAIAQTVPIAALAAGVTPILAATGGATGAEGAAATLVAFVALGSLAFGLTALALGAGRGGRFIRFIPYPVMAGFLGGCGLLIMRGGLGVTIGQRLDAHDLALLGVPSVQLRLAAALALVAAIVLLTRRRPVSTVLPAVAAAGWAAYLVFAALAGLDPPAARAEGWLMNFARGGSRPPVPLADLALIDWRALAAALPVLPVVVGLSVITVAMNVSTLEMASRADIDLDRELRSVGVQNLLAGAGGGLPAFHSVPLTLLVRRFRTPGVAAGLIVAAACVAAIASGDAFLAHVPTPILGAMVLWVGLSLAIDWLVRSYGRLPFREYLVVLLIVAVIVTGGLGAGLVVGLVAAAVLFAVEYGRVEIVRHVVSGRDLQSGIAASEQRRRALGATGDAILVVRLQGFLFFGTADGMRRRIQDRIAAAATPVRHLVIDFGRVSGLDSSAAISFVRLAQASGPETFTLVCCAMSPEVRGRLARAGFGAGTEAAIRFPDDLDHGLEWSEDALLAETAPDVIGGRPVPITETLATVTGDAALAARLMPYLDRLDLAAGTDLIVQGAAARDVYFIESGRAAVILAAGNERVRLATVGPGAIVGEMAFYLAEARSASVRAEVPVVAWRLSAASLARLETDLPEALIGFHRGMAALLAGRLSGANRLVRLMSD